MSELPLEVTEVRMINNSESRDTTGRYAFTGNGN